MHGFAGLLLEQEEGDGGINCLSDYPPPQQPQ